MWLTQQIVSLVLEAMLFSEASYLTVELQALPGVHEWHDPSAFVWRDREGATFEEKRRLAESRYRTLSRSSSAAIALTIDAFSWDSEAALSPMAEGESQGNFPERPLSSKDRERALNLRRAMASAVNRPLHPQIAIVFWLAFDDVRQRDKNPWTRSPWVEELGVHYLRPFPDALGSSLKTHIGWYPESSVIRELKRRSVKKQHERS